MNPALLAARRTLASIRAPRLRTMGQFAEAEIVIPTGPYANRRFKIDRNPFAGLWFAEMEKGWRRFVAAGMQQSGKTLIGFVIPILYHLFEVKETVICGLPSEDMIADKWTKDILPAIEASRYRDLLPTSGGSSRGGDVGSIQFRHGPTLKFMSGGGNDKKRAGFTSRVLVITETDGMDKAGGTSREADKISQMEGRLRAFGDRAVTYMECTVSLEDGRTWQEYRHGTRSRIAIRCQHCRAYVTPEREHLIGWRECESVIEAAAKAALVCPGCGVPWTEAERVVANHDAKLLHGDQTIDSDGTICGTAPATDTLGFRWTAANNLLVKTSVVGQDEWRASRDPDEANAEKKMNQFVWAKPYKADSTDLTQIDVHAITKRVTLDPRGRVPSDAHRLTVAVDLGKWLCHWVAIAWRPHATPHVIEYGRLEVASRELGEEHAILVALREFRDSACASGWPADSAPMKPSIVFVDSGDGDHTPTVMRFCAESPGFYATKGRGIGQIKNKNHARDTGSKVIGVGDGYDIVQLPGEPTPLVEVNADKWKTWVHARIQTPVDKPGALTLYQSAQIEHLGYAKHLTAEKKVEEFVAGKGTVTRWEAIHRNNHWFDATYLACAAGHAAGERLIDQPVAVVTMPQQTAQPATTSNPLTSHRGKW